MDPFEEKRSMLHFMEDEVRWTEEKYSLTSFREQERFKLPTLIHITSGYFGKDDSETFSSDDTLVLYEWKLQERVLGKKGSVSISIPLDFKYKLEVLEPHMPRRLLDLSQITQQYRPPVQVRFGPNTNASFTLSTGEIQAETFGQFTLMSSHLLEYATASTTAKGKISTEELVCLPIYRKVRFVVATRLQGMPMEELRHYFHSFLDHMETTLTLGILEYTELLDTMEEYDYIRTIPSGMWGKSRKDDVDTTIKKGQYTLLKKVDPGPSYEPIETDHRSREKHNSPGHGPGKYTPIKRRDSKRPHLPIELPHRMKRDDVYIPIDIPISPENPRPTSPLSPKNAKQTPVASISPSVIKPPTRQLPIAEISQAPPLFPRSASVRSAKRKVPPPVSPRPLNPIHNKHASPPSGLTGSWVTTSAPSLSDPRHSPTVSAFPMPIHDLVIRTLEDVPADLTGLSVGQVCHCLVLLNLGEFAPKFRHALIDGRILHGSSVEGLEQEFSMGHLSARKLAMFANDGWRPKK